MGVRLESGALLAYAENAERAYFSTEVRQLSCVSLRPDATKMKRKKPSSWVSQINRGVEDVDNFYLRGFFC